MCSINNVCQALKGFFEDSGKLNLSIIKCAKVLTWVPISSAEEVWTRIPESEYFDCHWVYHWDLGGRLKKNKHKPPNLPWPYFFLLLSRL